MKKFFTILFALFFVTQLYAANISGTHVPDTISINNVSLKLNGYGIRKKWFVKVYIASLYTTNKIRSYQDALKDNTEKVIRLDFLHDVDKNKVTEALREAFIKITPDIPDSEAGKKFFAQFNTNFKVGDVLEIALLPDGTVITKHNGKALGMVKSARLAFGLLAIYIGDKPIDEELKNGMLGR